MTINYIHDIIIVANIATGCKEVDLLQKNITIYTIAEKLGVTPSMVSRAFNPNASINEEKRKLILETADKYNFVPNKLASRLSMHKIKIGVLVCWKFAPVSEKIVDGIKKAYKELADYKIQLDITLVSFAEKKPEECEDELNKYIDYDGVILSGFGDVNSSEILKKFSEKNPNVVHVQNAPQDCEYLFASMHSPDIASALSAEFLYNCLKRSERKNILLLTGNPKSVLHRTAEAAFRESCRVFGLNLIEAVSKDDSGNELSDMIPSIFEKHRGMIDGIYITTGNSVALCEYIYNNRIPVHLVTFDIHDKLNKYINNGTVSATIYQNLEKQGRNAFEKLVHYLIKNEIPDKKIYTNVELIMKSNLGLYTY